VEAAVDEKPPAVTTTAVGGGPAVTDLTDMPEAEATSQPGAIKNTQPTTTKSTDPSLTGMRSFMVEPFAQVDGELERLRSRYPRFFETLEAIYPGAKQYEEAAASVSCVLKRHGFDGRSSIAMISQCRDELTKPWVSSLDALWGGSFNISSLGGMVFCGKTAFKAGFHHAPQDETGRERYCFFVGPHIAISGDGEVGKVERRGRKGPSSACGALVAFSAELRSGHIDTETQYHDLEMATLKRSILNKLTWGKEATLTTVTLATMERAVEDVKTIMNEAVDPDEPHSWAIASGILIHGPEQSNFFWAGTLDVEEPQKEAKSVLSELHRLTRRDYTDEMVRHHKSLAEQTGRILCGDASEFPF